MTNLEILYRQLATEYSLPVPVVEGICRYQFKFTADIITGDSFATVRWPFLLSFKPMQDRLERYKESKHWNKETQSTIRQ